ncbi:MAG: Glu-tRNA(Gln) amidotransferase subunit GatE [Candidatus Nanohaloarchaea archaeon]|nr:Glu-tRNA(Gln) amidotransferase subunit GatE [Candidatus Nanohaloarchaea archaeon]
MMDYDELGFKCGIEIHQQLDTETKLFCACSTDMGNDKPVAKVQRYLRPVAGESGNVDRAAQFEQLRDKSFVYNVYRDTTCLVELDEEPPHPINQEALDTALQVAKLTDCQIPDEIHVMRKTVIDGSNTSGFQRTAIIGLDGELETEEGTVAIDDMELEEESAGIHTRKKQQAVYDLDRLGIPLIEIGTDASIQNPKHAKEVAMKIGMLLRSTGNVKRGLGTIRQDVNVSIAEGARVEIKGFQDVKNMDQLVRNEVERQQELLAIKDELEERGIDDVDAQVHEATNLFADSDNQIIGRIIESDGGVYATKIPFEGLMNRELCGGKTLGKEFADYAKAHGLNGIMHTDEDLSKYGLEDEFDRLADELDKEDGEVVVIAAGRDEKAENALQAVVDRAAQCLEGVPEETRNAEQDFTTSYARPLPGSARMYPETDIPPFEVGDDYLKEIAVPETLDQKIERLADDVGDQMAEQLVESPHFETFEDIKDSFSLELKDVANFFTNILKDVQSRHDVDTDRLSNDQIQEMLRLLDEGEINKDALSTIAKELAQDPDKTPQQVVDEEGLGSMGEDEVRAIVQDVLEEQEDMIEEQGEHARGALMGEVMQEAKGKADGSLVNRVLSEELQKKLDELGISG